MHEAMVTPDQILSLAIEAAKCGEPGGFEALDPLPAPIYMTNNEGRITYYNPACVEFSGREPALGLDSWCVSWKLYTDDGQFLPHEQCPMAVAIREHRVVRGVTAIAERPDGTRVNFMPYPTPLVDDDGNYIGAVNLLVDITAARRVLHLREQASRCRRLASSTSDQQAAERLAAIAVEFDQMVRDLETVN